MKRGYIYKMWSKTDDKLVYFGSTTKKVSRRIADHNYNYKSWKNGKTNFTSSYLIFDAGDYDYMCMEHIDFEEPYELKNRERWYIENNDCVNKNIPNRNQKEYQKKHYEANKEKKKEYDKNYKEANADKIIEYQKNYREQNRTEINKKQNEKVKCDCGCIVSRSGLSPHRKSQKHLKWLENQS
jgi:alpha-galactosidase/6-phospho-beta-glucosidase family protein